MKTTRARKPELLTELLLLPDGRVLAQNLTQPMAALLLQLNPDEPAIKRRVRPRSRPYSKP